MAAGIPRVEPGQLSLGKEAREQVVASMALNVPIGEVSYEPSYRAWHDLDDRWVQVWWGPGYWPLHGEVTDHNER